MNDDFDLTPEQLADFGQMVRKEIAAKIKKDTAAAAVVEAKKSYAANPDFPLTHANVQTLQLFINNNGIPETLAGMTNAHRLLLEAGAYEVAPPRVPVEPEVTLADVDAMSSGDYLRWARKNPERAEELETSRHRYRGIAANRPGGY